MHGKVKNDMESLNISFLVNPSKPLQVNEPDMLNRNVMAAILLSLLVHCCGGWLFMQVAGEAPVRRRMLPIEVTIVNPVRQKPVIPVPPPTVPRPAHPIKTSPRATSMPAPVAPPKPAPVVEHVNPPQEIKSIAEKTVQPSQPLPAAPSREKALTGAQSLNTPSLARTPAAAVAANTTGLLNGTEGLPVVGPRYDAAYLSNPVPQYPVAARRLKLQGTATIRVFVSPDGRPKTVKLEKTSGARILDDAALDAVQHWLFVPARRGDKPVAAEVDVPVRFRLN
jgi:protein TonB